jgi:hypothetical protein
MTMINTKDPNMSFNSDREHEKRPSTAGVGMGRTGEDVQYVIVNQVPTR